MLRTALPSACILLPYPRDRQGNLSATGRLSTQPQSAKVCDE